MQYYTNVRDDSSSSAGDKDWAQQQIDSVKCFYDEAGSLYSSAEVYQARQASVVHGTFQIGVGGSLGAGVGGEGEVGINISNDGIALYASGGGLATTPAGGVGLSITGTNAEHYDDINGQSIVAGGGYGPVAGGTVIGNNYTGVNMQFLKYTDVSPVSPSAYTGKTYTVQTRAWNPVKTIRNLFGIGSN